MGVVKVGLKPLFRMALHSASLLGYGSQAHAIVSSEKALNPTDSLRALLETMALAGLPLLVATGRKDTPSRSGHESVATFWKTMCERFNAGSPIMIFDENDNLVAMGLPMGDITYVPPGQTGFLAAELKGDPSNHSQYCIEMWLDIVGVYGSTLQKSAWYRGSTCRLADRFNWTADDHATKGNSQSAHLYVPRGSPLSAMFPMPLAAFESTVGDFQSKLRTLRHVPREPTKRTSSDMYYVWRRAMLVRLALEFDTLGTAWPSLATVLPPGLAGPVTRRGILKAPAEAIIVWALKPTIEPELINSLVSSVGAKTPQRKKIGWA